MADGSAAPRIAARDLLTEPQLAEMRSRSLWRGLWMIAHAWGVIFAAIALVAWWTNPLTFVLAVMLIGTRQLGLAILMHEGAHGCFSTNQKLNMWLSQWLCAYPIFAETRAYRRYHLQHHARTQQEDDPDLVLSAPFPITKTSYKRKFWRDITGRTGYAQRKAQLIMALGDPVWPLRQRASHFWNRIGLQLVVNGLLFAGLAVAGPVVGLSAAVAAAADDLVHGDHAHAQHCRACGGRRGDDALRNTRTTLTNWLERAFVAPYFVNYHLEHHLFYYVPCYNLPKLHRDPEQGPARDPHGDRSRATRRYCARPRRGRTTRTGRASLVHGLRRQANANANSAKAGF
jgi:fatty acid desaturase